MHQKVIEAYNKAGVEFQMTTQDQVEQDFMRRTKGSTIQRRIDQIYRTKNGDRDYIVYNVTEIGKDLAGNEYSLTKTEGKYELPIFNRQYDNRTGEVQATSIARSETKFEIPFSRRNIERILKSGTIPTETKFVLDAGYAKFGGIPPHEFMGRHFDDLYEKATVGKMPEKLRELPDDDEVERDMRHASSEEKPRDAPVVEAYDEEEEPPTTGRELVERADRRKYQQQPQGKKAGRR